jgi:hypothetical protein
MSGDQPTPEKDWAEFPPLDGPTLDDLPLPVRAAHGCRQDIEAMQEGRAVRVVLRGGSAELAIALGRTAARAMDRRLAVVRVTDAAVRSPWFGETDRRVGAVVGRARALMEEGFLVILLLEDFWSLLADAHRGRLDFCSGRSILELVLTEDLAGLPVYCTADAQPQQLPPVMIKAFMVRSCQAAT